MREYTPETITDVVVEQMATTQNLRLKEVMESLVRHLHAFAREIISPRRNGSMASSF